MTTQEFAQFLEQTLEDRHLSRGERQQISQIAAAVGGDEQKLIQFRKLAFEKTAAAMVTLLKKVPGPRLPNTVSPYGSQRLVLIDE